MPGLIEMLLFKHRMSNFRVNNRYDHYKPTDSKKPLQGLGVKLTLVNDRGVALEPDFVKRITLSSEMDY